MLRKSKLRNRFAGNILGERMPTMPGSGSAKMLTPPPGYTGWWLAGYQSYSDAGTTPVAADGTIYQINNRTGSAHAIQTTAGLRPVYKTGIINGKPVARFDGTDDYLDAALDVSGYSAITIGIAFAPKNYTQSGYFSCSATVNAGSVFVLFQRERGATRIYINGGYQYSVAHPLDTFAVFVLTWDGTTWKLWLNGVQQENYVGGSTDKATATHCWLGAGFPAVSNSDVKEVLVYNSALNTTDVATLNNYLMQQVNPFGQFTVYDSMTGTNGTTLQSHSPEKGGSWTKALGNDATLDGSGHVKLDFASESRYIIPGSATGTIIASLRDSAGGVSDANKKGIIFNYQDANNFWFAGGGFNFATITKTIAGVESAVGSGSAYTGSTTNYLEFKLVISANGDDLNLYIDGVSFATASVSNRELKSNTTAGIRFINNGPNYVYSDLFAIQ